jgi:hypothetical protein
MDYSIRKEILWESEEATEAELSEKEIEFIRKYQANNPEIGYNRWPKFTESQNKPIQPDTH